MFKSDRIESDRYSRDCDAEIQETAERKWNELRKIYYSFEEKY